MRRVREKESEIKAMEMKYKEDLEMKKGELRELKKEFVDATKFDDVLDNAILAMTEIQEELPECKRLFSEEDPEGEKRRLSLANVFKRARERLESESAAGTPRPEAAEALYKEAATAA